MRHLIYEPKLTVNNVSSILSEEQPMHLKYLNLIEETILVKL
jgi:hypothetical protein